MISAFSHRSHTSVQPAVGGEEMATPRSSRVHKPGVTPRHASNAAAPAAPHEGHTLFGASVLRTMSAKASYVVKGEDVSRTCSIELSAGVVVQFYAVLDGHGGARAARFAAEHLPTLIAAHYAQAAGETRSARLQAACKAAFVAVDQQFARLGPYSDGTTATCVIVDNDEVTVANVGDSAAVLYLPDGTAAMLSADHRVARRSPAEHDRIVAAGAQIGRIKGRDGNPIGPERIYPGGLSVSRSLGDSDSTAAAIAEPDVTTVTLPSAGGVIVLASDGVWDFVDGVHVARLTGLSRKPKCGVGWLSRALMRTVNQANMEIDDATLICIELKQPPLGDEVERAALTISAKVRKLLGFHTPNKADKPGKPAASNHTSSTPSVSSDSEPSSGGERSRQGKRSAFARKPPAEKKS